MNLKGGWLTVNRKCNLRCPWCYAEATEYLPNQEMSFELATKLAKLLKEIDIRHILIIGGEPTLWKPLFRFNDFCRKEEITTGLVTNGLLFANDRFVEKYRKHPCNSIGLSIKAGSPEQYKKVAGFKGNFTRLEKALTRIAENFTDNVNITFNSFYLNNLTEIIRFVAKCGFKRAKFEFCTTTFLKNQPKASYMVHPYKIVEIITSQIEEMREYVDINFEMNLPFCIWPPEFIENLRQGSAIWSGCQVMGNEGAIFDTDGTNMMCNALFDYPLGKYKIDFSDGGSYLEFRQSREISNLYDQVIAYPSKLCKECSIYEECGGGCPLLWFIYKPEEIIKRQPYNS